VKDYRGGLRIQRHALRALNHFVVKQIVLLFTRLTYAAHRAPDQNSHRDEDKDRGQIIAELGQVEKYFSHIHRPHINSTPIKKRKLSGKVCRPRRKQLRKEDVSKGILISHDKLAQPQGRRKQRSAARKHPPASPDLLIIKT
jgi:hypothetical protein